MRILQATIEDAPEILALQRAAYQTEARLYDDFTIPPLTQSLEELQAEFASHTILKAVVEERLVGSVRGCSRDGLCHVGRLIVHPDFQRRGIGTALLLELERCSSAGRFELFTGHRSASNLRLYERLGYRMLRRQRVHDRLTLVFMHKERNVLREAAVPG